MKSICLSQEEVIAFMDGRLTEVVRPVKGIDQDCDGLRLVGKNNYAVFWNKNPGKSLGWLELAHIHCPYGQPGDKLALKETWLPDPPDDDSWEYCMFTDGVIYNFDALPNKFKNPKHTLYKASWGIDTQLRWRSPATMPQWAVRLFAEIESAKVMRVQDLGFNYLKHSGFMPKEICGGEADVLMDRYFRPMFDLRYGNYDNNPWVWVIGIRSVE